MFRKLAVAVITALLAFMPVSSIFALDGNKVANGSLETVSAADANLPDKWTHNSWGTNTTTFSYVNGDAQDGSKSVKVETTAYTDGDAKWFASPVAVTPGTGYSYNAYYKANVATTLVAAFTVNGAQSYVDLPVAPAAANWTSYDAQFTAPAGATDVTVYHLLMGVGTLSIDNVSVTEDIVVPPPTGELSLPNPSVELGNATPAGWAGNGWGTNTRSFEYVNGDAHHGTKSAKLTVSGYTDGDAKWRFDPINTLIPNHQYRFTGWYKSNTIPKVVAEYTVAGSPKYFGMPAPQPGANAQSEWQKYSDTFTVPEGATAVTIFMFLDRNGWLQTDDYSLEHYTPTGFSEPLLTLTFDDGHEENAANALPLLEQNGFKSTQCFATTFIEGKPQATLDKVLAFKNAGHEICSHSVTHPFMTTLTDTNLDYEAKHSQEYLESLVGQPIRDFATPYGDYDVRVNETLKKYYDAHRTVDEGFNSKDNYDPYRLRVQNMLSTTTAQQVADWVAQAEATNTWLILVYHRIANDPGQYDNTIADFTSQLAAIKASGIKVATFKDALATTKAQMGGGNPTDTTPPVVTAGNVVVDVKPPYVAWSANEAFSAVKVEYGAGYYDFIGTSTTVGNDQIASFGNNLLANTRYVFRISVTDMAGNVGVYASTFVTPAGVPPSIPVISELSTGTPGSTTAQVTWKTAVPASIKFEYGTTNAYGTVNYGLGMATNHSQTLTGLTPNTMYFFKITATTLTGEATSASGFMTAPTPTGKTGDVNDDNLVDALDLSVVMSNWNKTGATRAQGDVNNDGTVDALDLSAVLTNWSK
jgi:peptidoglycan/xylan/chitin deacetylase (PgdA/CDA1 family)